LNKNSVKRNETYKQTSKQTNKKQTVPPVNITLQLFIKKIQVVTSKQYPGSERLKRDSTSDLSENQPI